MSTVLGWTKKGNLMYLTPVVSDGASGSDWLKRLKCKGFRVHRCAEELLLSPEFFPTTGTKYNKLVILPSQTFQNGKSVRLEAEKIGLVEPDIEAVCLVMELLTRDVFRQMKLWWLVGAHKLVGYPYRLYAINWYNQLDIRTCRPTRIQGLCGGGFIFSQSSDNSL